MSPQDYIVGIIDLRHSAPSKGLCKVKKIPKIIWKWVGGSRSHLDNKKKLENRPKIKFCVCTIRPCLTVHMEPRDVHACGILSRIL